MPIKFAKTWTVDRKLLGKEKKESPGEFRKATDISGIACEQTEGFPRNGLVIDDEAQAAQLVTVRDGVLEAGPSVPLISDTYNGLPLELDGEGVGYENGFYYVIGSHGHPRKKDPTLNASIDPLEITARIDACSKILQVSADASHSVTESTKLKPILLAMPSIRDSVDQPLDVKGLTIEGLAITDARAFVGLRSPVGKDGAYVVSVSVNELFGPSTGTSQLHELDLGGRGIRDIAWDGAQFILLAGPSFNEGLSFQIFTWDGVNSVGLLAELPPYSGIDGTTWKPEGMLPLGYGPEGRRILILLDSAPQGAPQEIIVV